MKALIILSLILGCLAACEFKSDEKNDKGADVPVGTKLYPSYDAAKVYEYSGFDPKACATSLCAQPPSAEIVNEFRKACERDGFKMVKGDCCNAGACTGLPRKLLADGSSFVDTKVYPSFVETEAFVYKGHDLNECKTIGCGPPSPEVQEQIREFQTACEAAGFKMISTGCCSFGACTGLPKKGAAEAKVGDKLYPDFNAANAITFEGFNPKTCETVRCAPPSQAALDAFKEFETACTKEGFKIVQTGCCNTGSCTGLPKKAERDPGVKPGDKVYPNFKETDAIVYKGFDPSSCAAILCAAPSPQLLEAFKEFEAECKNDGFAIVRTSCCDLGACTGLPKK